jgi:hypothetical protein
MFTWYNTKCYITLPQNKHTEIITAHLYEKPRELVILQ